jgi:AcrR family transcriptional regulator
VSPKAADPAIRTALIDAAALLLAEGPQALTTRRLAEAVGTSTMAVYTYFSGMDELRHAVRKEGFDRLAAHLEAIGVTDDPVADVAASGGAYVLNALSNAHLYRFMFMEPAIDSDDAVGEATFETLVAGVERAIQAGRFEKADAYGLATQLWAMGHGIVTLHLAGLMTLDEAIQCVSEMGKNLFIAFGDDVTSAEGSIKKAQARFLDEERVPLEQLR